ncbi:hypothetical protein [Ornithobacterium rhinotracheale]|uniref:hypothetical protein n=1 Tax=Ornithobacterium rhinotracheale TaxID=28251 RepID=UPI0040365E1F
MKTLLYLHGLNSCLHDDRREALQSYDVEILAPSIDYEGTSDLFLSSTYKCNFLGADNKQ